MMHGYTKIIISCVILLNKVKVVLSTYEIRKKPNELKTEVYEQDKFKASECV